MLSGEGPQVTQIIGVYDADSSLIGELSSWVGARFGGRHCALCRITHGTFRRRDEWARCVQRLPVPFVTYHRDELPDEIRALTLTSLPVVIFVSDDGATVTLERTDIEACAGSVSEFVLALLSRL